MSSDQIAQMIYLGLLVTVIAGYFFMQNRLKLGKTLQMAGIWVLIFIGAIAGVGLWQDIRSTVLPQRAAFTGPRGQAQRAEFTGPRGQAPRAVFTGPRGQAPRAVFTGPRGQAPRAVFTGPRGQAPRAGSDLSRMGRSAT